MQQVIDKKFEVVNSILNFYKSYIEDTNQDEKNILSIIKNFKNDFEEVKKLDFLKKIEESFEIFSKFISIDFIIKELYDNLENNNDNNSSSISGTTLINVINLHKQMLELYEIFKKDIYILNDEFSDFIFNNFKDSVNEMEKIILISKKYKNTTLLFEKFFKYYSEKFPKDLEEKIDKFKLLIFEKNEKDEIDEKDFIRTFGLFPKSSPLTFSEIVFYLFKTQTKNYEIKEKKDIEQIIRSLRKNIIILNIRNFSNIQYDYTKLITNTKYFDNKLTEEYFNKTQTIFSVETTEINFDKFVNVFKYGNDKKYYVLFFTGLFYFSYESEKEDEIIFKILTWNKNLIGENLSLTFNEKLFKEKKEIMIFEQSKEIPNFKQNLFIALTNLFNKKKTSSFIFAHDEETFEVIKKVLVESYENTFVIKNVELNISFSLMLLQTLSNSKRILHDISLKITNFEELLNQSIDSIIRTYKNNFKLIQVKHSIVNSLTK